MTMSYPSIARNALLTSERRLKRHPLDTMKLSTYGRTLAPPGNWKSWNSLCYTGHTLPRFRTYLLCVQETRLAEKHMARLLEDNYGIGLNRVMKCGAVWVQKFPRSSYVVWTETGSSCRVVFSSWSSRKSKCSFRSELCSIKMTFSISLHKNVFPVVLFAP